MRVSRWRSTTCKGPRRLRHPAAVRHLALLFLRAASSCAVSDNRIKMSQTMEVQQNDASSSRGSNEEPEKTQKSRRPPSKQMRTCGHGWRNIALMVLDRQRFPTTASEGMAAHPHTQNRTAALLRSRRYIRAHWRSPAMGQLDSPRADHRLLSMQHNSASMWRWSLRQHPERRDHELLQEQHRRPKSTNMV